MQLDLFKDVEEKIDWKDPVQVSEYRRKYYQEYRLKNKEKLREYAREYGREYAREYGLKNKEKLREYAREYRLNNKEKIRKRERKYRLNNKEKIRESVRRYRINNKEKIRKRKREYRLNNKEKIRKRTREYYQEYRLKNKEKIRKKYEATSKTLAYKEMRRKYKQTPEFKELRKQWRKTNSSSVLASGARRRGRKRKALPKWLNDCPIERKRLQSVYHLARIYASADGIKRHVDHMWPLSDGGVHWSGNLQILTAVANLEKGSYSCPKLKKQIKLNLKEARLLND